MAESTAAVLSSDSRPPFLVRLGVGLPCSPEDVEEAYRARVKQEQTEGRIDSSRAADLRAAYEQAREYARFHSSRRRWLSDSIERYIEQQRIIAEVEHRGGRVRLESIDWLKREIGEDFAQVVDTIAGIYLPGTLGADTTMTFLAANAPWLTSLHELDLAGSDLTDRGAEQLRAFPYLRRIDLSRTEVGNRGLGFARSLSKLEWVNLVDTRVTRLERFWLRLACPEVQIVTCDSQPTHSFEAYFRFVLSVFVVYFGLTFVATHMSLRRVPMPKTNLPLDKLFHFVAYAGHGFLLATLLTIHRRHAHVTPRRFALELVVCWLALGAWAAIDEITQLSFGRTSDVRDWLADVAGATTGFVLFAAVRATLKRVAQWRLA